MDDAEQVLIARLRQRAAADATLSTARASDAMIRATEAACGIALPRLLVRLYCEIANGGFGPGYGLLGVDGGHRDDRGQTMRRWNTSGSLLPICHWGCGIYSLVDASTSDARMWGVDPNPGPTGDAALFPQDFGLERWLERWLDDDLHQPWLVEDPATGRWRGATDGEYVAAFAQDLAPPITAPG